MKAILKEVKCRKCNHAFWTFLLKGSCPKCNDKSIPTRRKKLYETSTLKIGIQGQVN